MAVVTDVHDAVLAARMADQARKIALRYFRKDCGLAIKADQTPVTLADKEIERDLREMLGTYRPDDGVFGEEMPATAQTAARQWVIDPIDGTGAFAIGSPLFGALIGLLDRDAPILGVIDACAMNERWVAHGGVATLNGVACRTSGQQRLRHASVSATAVHQYPPEDYAVFERVAQSAAISRLGGDSYSYGLLASGFLDAVVESGLKPYDFLPIVPIVEAAGGVMTDWRGARLRLDSEGQVLAAASSELHAELLELIGRQ